MERLLVIMHAEPDIVVMENPMPLPEVGQGNIRFCNLSFCYPSRPDTLAFKNFAMDIGPDETAAFVGLSEAGKTTTVHLLLRFYDTQSGRIEIDGIDIPGADPEQVRNRIGLVPQATIMFGATARENIRYGRPDAIDAEIEAVARAAAADDFISTLPDGRGACLGERRTRHSSGQR